MERRDGVVEFAGGLLTLLNPVSLLGGVVVLGLCLTHGAHFTALKTGGQIREDARVFATKAGVVTAGLAVVLLLWLGLTADSNAVSWVTSAVAAVALLLAIRSNARGAEGWAFVGTTVTIASAVATYFVILFPNAMNGSTGLDLTLAEAASSPLTLRIMTWAAVLLTPIALLYTAWNYWVFRRRISTHHIPEPVPVQ